MSKRKQNQEVHQPDDKLFKTVMQEKENAAEYLKTYYPELAKSLELSTLEILREKFSIPN
ncbi:MAG TPA: transposase, partial [Phaeodactylibacter sp.]|nr:transposase [Phaeodactylibacter sp.]